MTGKRVTSSHPPNLLSHLDEILPHVRLPDFGLVLDFDGTLSELVPSPDNARIYPGIVAPLRSLADKLALVAVMSGRAANDVNGRVGIEKIVCVGNHGAEYIIEGELMTLPQATQDPSRIGRVIESMRPIADGPGVIWENKGFSAAIHYRMAADRDKARNRLALALETAPGIEDLEVFWGNMVLELRARVGVNKGYAINKLARDWKLGSVVFLGDDTTDVDALRSLKDARARHELEGVGVAVIQEGTPEAVLESADYSLCRVPEVAKFLKWLDKVVS